MTTTELYSGYNADGKPSSRIIRPPGGQSSNIFGTDEPNPQQPMRQQREMAKGTQNHGQNGAAKSTSDAQQEYQRNKPKGRAEAPFASFSESGKSSVPSQFDKCEEKSQNEADFRSYSVTAYREAAQQNAATRERARGQASGSFNPITHEETFSNASPYKDYEQTRMHPQQVAKQQPQRMVRGQNNAAKAQFNPITGEDYPADYGQKYAKEGDQYEEDESHERTPEDLPANSREYARPSATSQPSQQQRFKQPPGGKSTGLW